MRKLSLAILLLIIAGNLEAQDFSKIDTKNLVKIGGGLNASGTYYTSNNGNPQRDPFFWIINGNVNVNFFDIFDVPVSFTFSQQNKNFSSHPTNVTGFSPKYKWVTLHLGYRSMQFSGFTMAGLNFMGGGLELTPPKSWIKYKGFYGRFNKATEGGTDGMISNIPAFDRWGFGSMVSLGSKEHNVDLIFLKVKDDIGSLKNSQLASLLNPKENLVVSFKTTNSITKAIKFDFEYAMSAFTEDTRSPVSELSTYSYINNLGSLFHTVSSSSFNNAINSNISYAGKAYQLKLSYKRIGPEYKSLGIPFISNNLEDVTGSVNSSFLKNRISLGLTGGVQRNNLDNSMKTTMKRLIGSVNSSIALSKKLNLNLVYSNFMTNTLPVDVFLLDSFSYIQLTQNSSTALSYTTGDNYKHSFMGSATFQNANTEQNNNGESLNSKTALQTYNISYGVQMPDETRIQVMMQLSNFDMGTMTSQSYGPTLLFARPLFNKKMNAQFSSSYIKNIQDNVVSADLSNFRFSLKYKLGKSATFAFNNSFIYIINKNTSEYKGSISFNYQFALKNLTNWQK